MDPTVAHLALKLFGCCGKGNQNPAQLSLGNCYAQAKLSGAALLFKGNDFSKTDIESAS
jgi:ribonuclease VapC